MRKTACLIGLVVLFFSSFTFAQSDEPPFHRWTIKFGGGATIPTGESHNRLTTGWHFLGGGGINFNRRFGVLGEFQLNQLGVTRGVIQQLNVPGADARVMSVTANPFIKLATGRVQPYIIGGVGYYRRTVDLTQPASQVVTFFDPFFGFVNGVVPTTQVIGSISRNAFGGNLGGGMSVAFSGGAFFVEGRYHHADTPRTATQMFPISVGFRW